MLKMFFAFGMGSSCFSKLHAGMHTAFRLMQMAARIFSEKDGVKGAFRPKTMEGFGEVNAKAVAVLRAKTCA